MRVNNKLIAEFMGNIPIFENEYQMVTHNNMCYGIDELKYDTDWNWLMEVVEKIESFEDENKCAKFNVIIEQSFVEIIDCNTSNEIVSIDANTKIEAIYLAIVEFIKLNTK